MGKFSRALAGVGVLGEDAGPRCADGSRRGVGRGEAAEAGCGVALHGVEGLVESR